MCQNSPWMTGSDLRTLCVQAAMISQEQAEGGKRRVLRWEHFETAAKRYSPSIRPADLIKIREFAEDFDPAAVPKIKLRVQGESNLSKVLQPGTRKPGDRWKAALSKRAGEKDFASGPSHKIARLDEPSYPYPRNLVKGNDEEKVQEGDDPLEEKNNNKG
ncbi:hypothetical protein F4859DRAFT_500591 [Xylaria cf. heliscus]|nr:hypothetical protein F4859DRAFT_500591 [Xylaria cf. heliscus]